MRPAVAAEALAETAVPLRRSLEAEMDRIHPAAAEARVPVADRPLVETEGVSSVGATGAPAHHPLAVREVSEAQPELGIGPQVGGTISLVSWGS